MTAPYHVCLISLLAALSIIQGIQAISYTVTNNARTTSGGQLFQSRLGEDYAMDMMKLATKHIWRIFDQYQPPYDREQVKQIKLFIQEMKETSSFQLKNEVGEIHISANQIASFPNKNMRQDFSDLIYYEMTHILQWKANGEIPQALRDGIAAYVVLIINDKKPTGWVEFGGGDKWDESPDVTAQFLKFCTEDLDSGFVPELNKKMKDSYKEQYFVDLTGETIESAWKEYKDFYGHHA